MAAMELCITRGRLVNEKWLLAIFLLAAMRVMIGHGGIFGAWAPGRCVVTRRMKVSCW